MKVVVIGGTGHIGTYLVPRLVQAGHDVICVSRQRGNPYTAHESWKQVKHVDIDRQKSERNGDFGTQIASLGGDIVIDLICFTPQSAQKLAEVLKGRVQHFLHCGTMWVHGHSEQVPTSENQRRNPFGLYGINKAKIETYLHAIYQENGFPITILHPGHITGPGWLPVNPVGNLNPEIFVRLSKGEEITLPNLGMETVHHVHADDVAQAFVKAIENHQNSIGESFHVVSEQALTLRGYAEEMARWFGKEPKLRFLPWEKWQKNVTQRDQELTWDHIAHSPCGSIAKAKQLLNYTPNYSSLQAVQESIEHYFEKEGIPVNRL
ncbi:NAD-dependent epimerase/dehydratase family protein [Ulvibacterium marinum]|uniref:NAD-dependent epimerase/dehydratase family protein n=1 Tax=Ulvibacterium marinum TaxID=2419782 RepID=A0A3B0C3V5_9FLAO|nr:NAD-dependent epimerase/dehydratase family protein [Ulvibacterium marinum]RKN78497.1 NAD-dependent epimerase/dehydratase family protein [Ulvibacterium marinum]